jgi:hypothetical protein
MRSKVIQTVTPITLLIDALSSGDGTTRERARNSLEEAGTSAVVSLCRTLQHSDDDHVRWEAAKALGAIGDVRAVPSLLKALEDIDTDVAWVAAEALKGFKTAAWQPLFRVLVKRGSDSATLRHGAHHVLRNQKASGYNDLLVTMREALDSSTVPELTTVAAFNMLRRMNNKRGAPAEKSARR